MKLLSTLLVLTALSVAAAAQNAKPANVKTVAATSSQQKEQSRQKFVLDVVHSAVGLPQSDPQDRLRVLYAAANVVAPIDQKLTQQLAKEGTAIETKLVAEGQKPAVSMLGGGHVDCGAATTFVQTLPPAAVVDAEQSLLGAISHCPTQVNAAAKAKLDAAVNQGVVAGRPIMAMMEAEGLKSDWSRAMFAKMFASLPAEASNTDEAPNYAAMLAQAAPVMDKDAVKTAGAKFLLWLGKLPDSQQRSVAVNLASGVLSDTLGATAYQELLRSDPMIQQTVNGADQKAMLPAPEEEEGVSVLQAIDNSGDRTQELNNMPAAKRAREAAASGFASGTSGDRRTADHYFDIAFASVDEVWSNRATTKADAPEVVQEVSEAAAQVDPMAALKRSQGLQDPSAEAISMLAVARVVVGQE